VGGLVRVGGCFGGVVVGVCGKQKHPPTKNNHKKQSGWWVAVGGGGLVGWGWGVRV